LGHGLDEVLQDVVVHDLPGRLKVHRDDALVVSVFLVACCSTGKEKSSGCHGETNSWVPTYTLQQKGEEVPNPSSGSGRTGLVGHLTAVT